MSKNNQIKNNSTPFQSNFNMLFQLFTQIRLLPEQKIKCICKNNLIMNILQIYKAYINFCNQSTKPYPLLVKYILRFFKDKYQQSNKLIYAISVFVYSWQKYLIDSLQVNLLCQFLKKPYQTIQFQLKTFFKIRKQLLRIGDSRLLDQISVTHQQAIGIIHTIYNNKDGNKKIIEKNRVQICKKLNELYIHLNLKWSNNTKLKACIFGQFLLECVLKFEQIQQEVILIKQQRSNSKQWNFSSKIEQDFKVLSVCQNKRHNKNIENDFISLNEKILNKFLEKDLSNKKFIKFQLHSQKGSIQKLTNNMRSNKNSFSKQDNNSLDRQYTPQKYKNLQKIVYNNQKFKNKLLKSISNNANFKQEDQIQQIYFKNQEDSQLPSIQDSIVNHNRNVQR